MEQYLGYKAYKETYYFKVDLNILLKERHVSNKVINITQKTTEEVFWETNLYYVTEHVVRHSLFSVHDEDYDF